ncbi:MAG: hypothetical protein AAB520_01725, partial [Patescibacteria group bacterium]
MKRKLFSFLLSFILLSFSFNIPLSQKTQAAASDSKTFICDDLEEGSKLTYTYDPSPLSWDKKQFNLHIKKANNLGTGEYKLLIGEPRDSKPYPEGFGWPNNQIKEDFNFDSSGNFDITINSKYENFDNSVYRAIYLGIFPSDADPIWDPSRVKCYAYIDLADPGSGPGPGGETDSCTLEFDPDSNFTPQRAKVIIKANGLSTTKYPDDEKLGFFVENLRTSADIKNSCITAKELRDGITLDSANGWSFDTGSYAIAVGNDFEFFGNCTIDGGAPKICGTDPYPNKKFNISAKGGFPYLDCTKEAAKKAAGGKFENWDQSKRLKFCSIKTGESPKRSGKAPYCIQDPYTPTPKGVCSDTPGVGIACPDDKCKTAIGP